MLLDKKKALYVKCCIIPNGVIDSQGDLLYSEDIKRIFTSFNNQDNFEVYHNDIPIPEVSLLENYISTTDETIGTAVVPSGSWNAVIRVDNPDIQSGLLLGEFKGVSLNNRIKDSCKKNLHGTVRYSDVGDSECIIPLLISFVEAGANGYGLHVMDYDAYIKKSRNIKKEKGVNFMNFKQFLDGLKSLIKEAEVSEEEPTIEKEDEEIVEEVEEKTEEEPTIEKEDSDFEARISKLEELVAKLVEPSVEKETEEEVEEKTEEEPVDEDTPKITKSEKVIIENKTVQHNNYYQMSGRDPITGIKIRKK